ncbi:MAG: PEP-CTERM sorting domain-containing protein [Fimbriimonadaceae bacterium]|nr:PEP-CTERM sorting domain-containing protein [Fimbriimonadaceae bacterium]
MKMKTILTVGVMLGTMTAATTASAAIQFDFSVLATGSTPSGTAPWATLVGTQNGSDRVDFTFTHNASSTAGQFITRLYMNIAPFPGNLNLTLIGSPPQYSSHSFSQNGHNDASSSFDFEMQFGTSNANGGLARLEPGESMSFFITGTGLTESSFDVMSAGTARKAMIHLQGIPGGQSGKLTPVPEPTSMAVLGIGALALLRRRKKRTG